MLAPFVATFAPQRDERRPDKIMRAFAFVIAAASGVAPQFMPPMGGAFTEEDSPLFVLHPTMQTLGLALEPTGRDRITKYREEAESLIERTGRAIRAMTPGREEM